MPQSAALPRQVYHRITGNKPKRHKMLWDENEAKPPEERYNKFFMVDPFHHRWSLPGANLSYGPTKYVGGARSSKQLLASLDRGRDGLPEMLVLV